MLEIASVRIRKVKIDAHITIVQQFGLDADSDHIFIRMADRAHLHLLAIQFETAVNDTCPQVDLLACVAKIDFLRFRTVFAQQAETDTAQVIAVGILGQPFGQFRLVGVTELVGDLFAMRLHDNRTVIFGFHSFGEGKTVPAPVGQGIKRNKSLQSGYIHPEGKLAVTYLCRTFQECPGRTYTMPLDNSFPVNGFPHNRQRQKGRQAKEAD